MSTEASKQSFEALVAAINAGTASSRRRTLTDQAFDEVNAADLPRPIAQLWRERIADAAFEAEERYLNGRLTGDTIPF